MTALGGNGTTPATEAPPVRSETTIATLDLCKNFGGLRALANVTLSVRRGNVHSVIGPNGAGKTCVFNCIMGQYRPDGGRIELDGQRIDGLEPNRIALCGIARTYQNIRLFRNMTALENVMVGLHRHMSSSIIDTILMTRRFRSEESESVARATELLDFVGIAARGPAMARNLPYGDQRRLEIARALATSPTVILLDEPAAGMNPVESQLLMDLIRRMRDEKNITVVLIEHEMRVVMGISDRISVLDRGRVLAEGTAQEIRHDNRVIEAYLGTGVAARRLAAIDRRAS